MSITKSLMLLLVVFLALGGAFGGVFAGGVAFGKTQGEEIALPLEANPPRQQFPNQSHRGRLTGLIEKVDGNTVTVNTSQGPLSATFGVDTAIRRFAEGTPSDLQPGTRVTLVGQPGLDGIVEARSVLLNPEDAYGFFSTQASSLEIANSGDRFQKEMPTSPAEKTKSMAQIQVVLSAIHRNSHTRLPPVSIDLPGSDILRL